MSKIVDVIKKFVDVISIKNWQIESQESNGNTIWNDIVSIGKTVQYEQYVVTFDNGIVIRCADNHIFIDEFGNKIFAKDSLGVGIRCRDGITTVVDVYNTGKSEHMYDVQLEDGSNHLYYSNGILSHNTTIYTVYLLWYAMYHPDKRVMVCGNKLSIAIEIMDRIRLGYEYCPSSIKIGVKTYNKGCIEFENNSIIRCFATGSSGCRGFSANCVTGDTMVTILDDYDNIYNIPIEQVETLNANSSINSKYNMMDDSAFMDKKKYYYVYRVVNKVNGKEYIGFHSTNNLDDGYMGSGKLLAKAVEKYGIDNFDKEIIQFFDTKEAAEQKERELVNEDYVKRTDTYNISLGGNVCILFGEDNGFYGKHHSDDAKKKMSESKKLYYSENDSKLKNRNTSEDDDIIINGVRYNSRDSAMKELHICIDELNRLLVKDGNGFVNQDRQARHVEFMIELEAQRAINHRIHMERVLEANQKQDRRDKISKALSGRKNTWNDKINKNQDKIRKTAEKHRGMKRSVEARKNMSDGLKDYYSTHSVSNKGKIWIHNPTTNEKKYVDKDCDLPIGWEKGMGRRLK